MVRETAIRSALVVGGCGSLGRHIIAELLQLSPTPEVTVFDLDTSSSKIAQGVEYFDVDITKKDVVDKFLRHVKPEVIFHTASPQWGSLDLEFYTKVNVEGTRNLIEAAKAVGTSAFVYTSSASVIHDCVSDLVEGDDSLPLVYLPQQKEVYSHTKAVADQFVLDSNDVTSGGMLTCCIRPAAIFCAGEGSVKTFVEKAAKGSMKYQIGNGKNMYDFTYVDNVVHAHLLAARCLLRRELQAAGEGFLITNDEHIPFWEFGRAVGAAAGYPTKVAELRSIPTWLVLGIAILAEWIVWLTSFGSKHSRLNRVAIRYSCITRTYRIEKAKNIIGYKPRVSLEEGIRRSGAGTVLDESKKVA